MPKTIKYVGPQSRWPEIAVTGKQSVWMLGQQEERSDAEADLLLATQLFVPTSQPALQDQSGTVLVPNGFAATRAAVPAPARGYVALADFRAAALAGQVSATVTDASRVAPDGSVLRGVRITANAGTACTADFDFTPATLAGGRLGFLAYVDPSSTGVDINCTMSIADGSGFTNWFTRNGLTANSRGWVYWTPGDAAGNSPSKWSTGGGTPVWGSTSFSRVRVRLDYSASQTPWIELYEITSADDVTRSAIAISIDDGYTSAYTIAAPELEKRGLRASFGIIADLVGTGGYMTLAQLQDLVARGHECVVHGPIGGAGSLLNYSASANRYQAVYNDIAFHQAYLRANGLDRNGSANIYVPPQGQDQFATGDETIRDAMKALGMVGARRAGTGIQTKRAVRGRDAFTLPIIGHVWTTAPAEAANITGIVNLVNAAASDRWDAVLMFHKFINGAAADSLEIDVANFRTILDAIVANRLAKTQDSVLLSTLVYGLAGKSQPIGRNVV